MPTMPDYQRVTDDLRAKIRSGAAGYLPGDKLPTKRQLMSIYDVNQQSVDTAMILLKAEGLVVGHQGRGTYVANPLPESN